VSTCQLRKNRCFARPISVFKTVYGPLKIVNCRLLDDIGADHQIFGLLFNKFIIQCPILRTILLKPENIKERVIAPLYFLDVLFFARKKTVFRIIQNTLESLDVNESTNFADECLFCLKYGVF
jgi:hypothetical protein